MKNIALLSIVFTFFYYSTSCTQRNFNEFNLIGLSGGLNWYSITTDNLIVKTGTSFTGGFQVRGNVYNNWDMLYGISFHNHSMGISLKENAQSTNHLFVNHDQKAVQLSVLLGYKIIREHLSLEAGPVLSVNGKLQHNNDQYENYIVDGYTALTSKQLEDISPVNFHLAAGITAGLRNFRVFAQYQYGVTNMLGKLNGKAPELTDFKGHSKVFSVGVTGYF